MLRAKQHWLEDIQRPRHRKSARYIQQARRSRNFTSPTRSASLRQATPHSQRPWQNAPAQQRGLDRATVVLGAPLVTLDLTVVDKDRPSAVAPVSSSPQSESCSPDNLRNSSPWWVRSSTDPARAKEHWVALERSWPPQRGMSAAPRHRSVTDHPLRRRRESQLMATRLAAIAYRGRAIRLG